MPTLRGCMSFLGAPILKTRRTVTLCLDAGSPVRAGCSSSVSTGEEKGADIAIGTLTELKDRGVEAELVICGCTPPKPVTQDGLTIIPYLDKNNPEQRNRLFQLYNDADFFLLPTRADCYGIVFCEAAAHGVPSIAPATGGVPCAVRDGETGILVPPNATKADYAAVIAEIFANPDRLARLRQSSRDAFEARLNWQVWGRRVSDLIQPYDCLELSRVSRGLASERMVPDA